MGGVIIAMLGLFIHARGPKIVLIGAAVLFIAFVVLGVVQSELRHIPVAIRFFCFSGLIIGMSVPSAIFLWLDSKKMRQQLDGKGEAAAPVAANQLAKPGVSTTLRFLFAKSLSVSAIAILQQLTPQLRAFGSVV